MEKVLIYISITLLAVFIFVSKIFSPIWLLIFAIFILWPERKKADFRPFFLISIFLLCLYAILSHFVVLMPFIIGAGIAYIIGPVIDFLEKRKFPRFAAILIILLPLIAVVPVVIFLLVINLINELKFLIERIPDFISSSRAVISSIIERLNAVGINIEQEFIINTVTNYLGTIFNGLIKTLTQVGQGVKGIIFFVYNFVLIPIFTYLLLAERESISNWVKNLIPENEQKNYLVFIERLNISFSRYFRGQIILMIVVGFIVGFMLWILGIRYYVFLGIIAALGNLIPSVGFVLSFIPAFLIGLFTPPALLSILKIVIVYLGEQLLENFFLGPIIIGKASRLNPAIVILALVLGSAVAGILGLIFAIPFIIFLREFLNQFLGLNL